MFILLLSFLSINISTTEGATKKIAHVNVKIGTLSVRSNTSLTSKKVGSLKKDAGVYVYAKTKSGWSEIRYKEKKAYVMTKHLKFANSYLADKKKIYTYVIEGKQYKHVYTGKNLGWDEWTLNKEVYILGEDKNGLHSGYPQSEYTTSIKYPIKIGKKWSIEMGGDGFALVTSVTKTVKVPAGTFKNCIEVMTSDGYLFYYAKNVGFVKGVYQGVTYNKLIKMEKK